MTQRVPVRIVVVAFSLMSGCSAGRDLGDMNNPTLSAGTGDSQPGAAGNAVSGGAGASAAGAGHVVAGGAGASAAGNSAPDGAGASAAGNPASGGTDGSAAGSEAQADCTPSAWTDPGTVPNPTVVAVAADAGTTHEMFGASKAWEGQSYLGATDGLSDYDYVEEEFFFTGTSPAYTSRMVVHRPRDPAKFSGTVIMEWYNVTGGIDIGPLWTLSREYMMRAGHVHVGVSAQEVGATALKTYDAERYAMINHPGDTAANAIFAQAAMAIRSQGETLLGACMPVHALIAGGQSQSSSMLSVYLSSAHPTDQIFDGFLLHSDPSGSIPASDPDVPVFVILTMSEGTNPIVDKPNLAQWEVAGATHNDIYLTNRGAVEQGGASDLRIECTDPMNDFPSFWVYDAALDWLHRWVRKGEKPPSAPALQTTTDQSGNVLGGVRIQDIDVPIATYTPGNAPKDGIDFISLLGCGLSGSVVALTPARLLELYPTHDDYVQKYTQAADDALAAGFLLQSDHDIAIEIAKNAPIPN